MAYRLLDTNIVSYIVNNHTLAAAYPFRASISSRLNSVPSSLPPGAKSVGLVRSLRLPAFQAPPWKQTTHGCGPAPFGTTRSSFSFSSPMVA